MCQQITKFRRKQKNNELSSLHRMQKELTKRLYQEKDVLDNLLRIQERIAECETSLWDKVSSSTKLDWLQREEQCLLTSSIWRMICKV